MVAVVVARRTGSGRRVTDQTGELLGEVHTGRAVWRRAREFSEGFWDGEVRRGRDEEVARVEVVRCRTVRGRVVVVVGGGGIVVVGRTASGGVVRAWRSGRSGGWEVETFCPGEDLGFIGRG